MPRTITITPNSGVFLATADSGPTATGATEAEALVSLANRIQEHGWDWPKPEPAPLTPSETDETPAES